MGWNSIASGLADEAAGFTRELILGLVCIGREGPLGGTPRIVGRDCKRALPWSPPLDGKLGADSG